ncbi:MAG: hypothetical protein ILP22_10020, partial [Oscillospiraceae bacterium]|nr:hypothetical protein [Oscillospiraceae bacterium]
RKGDFHPAGGNNRIAARMSCNNSEGRIYMRKKRIINIAVIILAMLIFGSEDQIPGFVVLKIIVNILLIIAMTVTTIMVYKGKEKV